MKKVFIPALLIFFCSVFTLTYRSLYAQEEKLWWIGAFGGIDRGKFSYSSGSARIEANMPESEWKSRAYFGIESDLGISSKLAIMIRPTYVQKGTYEYSERTVVIDGKNTDVNTIEDVTLSYFQLAQGVRGVFGKGSLKTSLFFGPTVDFLLSAKDHITFEGYGDTTVTLTDAEDLALGLMAGTAIGYMFESGISVFLEAVYDYSLANVFPDEPYAPSASMRDYRFGLSVFYQIK